MKVFILLLYLYTFENVKCEFNFTDKMKTSCKRYVCQDGYNYKDFFKVTTSHQKPHVKFEMHMAIKSKNNGHILLSSIPSPSLTTPLYEIVVGGGGNTFTELRRMRMRMGKSTTNTKDILSMNKFVPFWIRAHDSGLIEFGLEGKELPLVSYMDMAPLEINYFSFSGWNGIEALILYDCKVTENDTEDSVAVEKPLTPTENLRKILLKDYDRFSRPTTDSTKSSLYLHFDVLSVAFDVTKSILTTNGKLKAQWIDQKLIWNPADHDNITHIKFGINEIWKPDIKVFMALDLDNIEWFQIPIYVTNEGAIKCTARIISRTWCSPSSDLVHWPHDEHTCTVRMGLWSQLEGFNIELLKQVDETGVIDEVNYYPTEWELVKMVLTSEWSNYSPYSMMYDTMTEQNTFNIEMSIERIDDTYKTIFYAPLLCTILMIIVTFLTHTDTTVKVTILSVEQFFVLLFMFQVMNKIPAYGEHIPKIVLFYYWAMLSLWLSIVMNLLVFKMRSDPKPWMLIMQKFLLNLRFENCLLLVNIRVEDSYKNLQEGDSNKCEEDQESQWHTVGIILDRIAFLIFTIIFSIVCCV